MADSTPRKNASERCPNPKVPEIHEGHVMRLDHSDGDRETWRCVGCLKVEIRPTPKVLRD